MSTLERAIALAASSHAGQVDKAGAPYILHPLRVLDRVRHLDLDTQVAAVLHDVVEDTPVTLRELAGHGFSPRAVAAIDALTKRPEEEAAGDAGYFAFVRRAAGDDVARPVKLADVRDNRDERRLGRIAGADEARLARYRRAIKLLEAIERWHGAGAPAAPVLLPLRGDVSLDEVEAECPGGGPVYACDFHIRGAEAGTAEAGGLRLGRVLNVDHHADLPAMRRHVTSTALAAAHLRAHGRPERDARVVINHADCDSVLSSAMLMGWLPPDERLVQASVRADHTGAEDEVADLLQAMDEGREGDRTDGQYLESLEAVLALREGRPLSPCARNVLAMRRLKREAAKDLVGSGAVVVRDGVALALPAEELDGALLAPLVPDAAVVMLALPLPADRSRWLVKLRLGPAAPPGLTLHALGVREMDANYGGRWNAGSNRRPDAGQPVGGTMLEPEAYAGMLRERLARVGAGG